MNKTRNIIAVTTVGVVALAVTAGWSAIAGSVWPPTSYHTYSPAGTWSERNSASSPGTYNSLVTTSPEDPVTGKGFIISTQVNPDVSWGGMFPDATSWTPWRGTYVRTGPNTWQFKLVAYVVKEAKPQAVVLFIMLAEGTTTMTSASESEVVETFSGYLPSQDKDLDGLPDPGENPMMSVPATAQSKLL
jgi:hypothetical protein